MSSGRTPAFVVVFFVAVGAWCNCAAIAERSADSERAPSAATTEAELPFRDVTEERGIDFQHFTGFTGNRYIVEIMGSGAGFLDHGQDGDYDLYLLNGAPLPGTPPPPDPPRNRFFQNDGHGNFEEVTAAVGLGDEGYGMGIAVGDIDNDGDSDLFLSNYGADRLFRNRRDGTFEDITEWAGIDLPQWSTSAVFFDFDLDGDLDLYVASYVDFDPATSIPWRRAGLLVYCGPQAYGGLCDQLLRNDGTGRFTEVAEEVGITDCSGKGLGVVAGDFEGDGDPDLYVANDGTPNFLYINHREEGRIHFTEEALYYGAAYGYGARAEAGMGTDMGDFDGDLDLDITVTNLDAQTNSLYRNDEGTAVMEVSYGTGLGAATLAYVGFGTCFLDFDLDSDLDLVATNGHIVDNIHLITESSSFEQDDLLFENIGGRYQEILAAQGGRRLLPRRAGRGLAAADIDGDGDDDVIINNNGAEALLLENMVGQDHPALGLRLEGSPPQSNRDAYGARVLIEAAGRTVLREVHAGASYLASQDPRVRVGLPGGSARARATIRWPSGMVEEVEGLEAGAYHFLLEGSGLQKSTPFRR